MATFAPIMQYHSEFNAHRRPSRDRTPWNIAQRTGDETVVDVYRHYARLRERLVAYLVRESAHAVSAGLPLMRPLAFDDPADEQAWQHPLQYRLGRELSVAPVTEAGQTRSSVYVPAGEWNDLWTGDPVAGPGVAALAAPLERIPVLVRRGQVARLRTELALDG